MRGPTPSPTTAEQEFQRNASIAVARRAETVVAHEGSQVFLDHLGAWRDRAEAEGATYANLAAYATASADQVAENRRLAAQRRGAAEAYQNAMDLIPSLISQGREAMPITPTVDPPEQMARSGHSG